MFALTFSGPRYALSTQRALVPSALLNKTVPLQVPDTVIKRHSEGKCFKRIEGENDRPSLSFYFYFLGWVVRFCAKPKLFLFSRIACRGTSIRFVLLLFSNDCHLLGLTLLNRHHAPLTAARLWSSLRKHTRKHTPGSPPARVLEIKTNRCLRGTSVRGRTATFGLIPLLPVACFKHIKALHNWTK